MALLVLGALLFTQASFAFSSCLLERSELGQAIGSPASAVHRCDAALATDWTKYPNRCFGHCTSDLQTVGAAVALLRSPADEPVLAVQEFETRGALRTFLEAPRLGFPPPRILFHSFLI